MEYHLKKEKLEATILSKGAELVSLKKDGTEYMWCGDPTYWDRTAPILFPFVGSLNGKQYRYDGKTYHIGQHGFARDMEFDLVSESDTKLVMEVRETAETMEIYPFHFLLELSFELGEDGLTVGWKVKNTDEKTMYFSIGGHPAFNCPMGGRGSQSDYALRFQKEGRPLQEIVSELIGEGGLVTGERITFGLEDGYLAVTPNLFDADTIVLEDGQTDEVSLCDPEGKEYVCVKFPMPIVGIWTPIEKNAPFLCIEPWCGRCDDMGYEGELPDRRWGNGLKPGEVFETAYTIAVK
ncbi:aldose 1-epimerase family protein [bacterium 1XD8-76]|nr:aldose 1-epimerase family protein [bacterium 1XD8-76]